MSQIIKALAPQVLVVFGATMSGIGGLGNPILVFIGSGIGLVGGLWAAYDAQQERTYSDEERVKFERELRAKSDEIAELNRTIVASVTGGDSFCRVAVSFMDGNDALLLILHEGEHPLYDIGMRIVDLQEFSKVAVSSSLQDLSRADFINTRVGNLGPSQTMPIGQIKLPDTGIKDFNVFFSARNGFTTQLIRCRRVNEKWCKATQVSSLIPTNTAASKVLLEEIDPDFPRDDSGQVQW